MNEGTQNPGNASDSAAPPAPRGARRKRETRTKIMRAALGLMAERGAAGVAINEITEAADVGFGSFYNHFESKEALHAALVEEQLGYVGEALSHIADQLDDPAEILAATNRHLVLRAKENPVWGRFLLRTGLSARILIGGMGAYLLEDLRRGIESGRFVVDDLLMAFASVGGTSLAAIAAEIEFAPQGETAGPVATELGLNSEAIPERAAAAILRILGIGAGEAWEIANRPLPEVRYSSGLGS